MGRKRKGKPINGWLAIHKESGLTSTRVVERVKRITGAAKAGHGGTLDPFSEGLLPIALGEATKTITWVLEGDKSYRAWVRFGRETDTGDPTGKTTEENPRIPDEAEVREALAGFRGEIEQVPPAFSAIHIDGERAYEKARRGEEVEIPCRTVTIFDLTMEKYAPGLIELTVRCSKGTYIRSLARDLGRALSARAFLERLVRTETLGFQKEDGIRLEALSEAVENDRFQEVLMPTDRVLDDIPALRLDGPAHAAMRHGQSVWVDADGFEPGPVRVISPEGRFSAMGELSVNKDGSGRRRLKPRKLFLTTG